MTFALVHLSGPRRGHTQYFDQTHLLLGSDPRADLAFSADGDFPVAPLQAELYQSECRVRLRNLEPTSRTLVNDRPVDDVALMDRDLIQLGPKGPTLRFRIRSAEYVRCKRLRKCSQMRGISQGKDGSMGGPPSGCSCGNSPTNCAETPPS
ncbi:MAG: hypothetical protein KatS3mg082_0980 [Nitrospiraceae bacterium]|nr:MAG: hypothetical protein KatS3mg082_0980 [Nitrospiraceae bacterium]